MEIVKNFYDEESEKAVLGCILHDNKCLSDIQTQLTPDMFFFEKNKIIYQHCLSLYNSGVTVDLLSLNRELTDNGLIEGVGFTLEEYQKRQDKIRRESFDYLIKLTEANINASEKIDSWESVMPEVEDFDSWIFRQCEMYRSETDAGKRKRIRDEIVGRFAGERKVLKEKKVDKSIER